MQSRDSDVLRQTWSWVRTVTREVSSKETGKAFLMLDVRAEVASPRRGDDGQNLLEQFLLLYSEAVGEEARCS